MTCVQFCSIFLLFMILGMKKIWQEIKGWKKKEWIWMVSWWVFFFWFGFAVGKGWLDPFLQNLDPSLFQGVILGILTVFIPFALAFLTDALGKKQGIEKRVLNEEVFEIQKIFWLSVLSLSVFAFLKIESSDGDSREFFIQGLSIVLLIPLVFEFWGVFKKVLKYAKGDKNDFLISYLKKLKIPKDKDAMKEDWEEIWGVGEQQNLEKEKEFPFRFFEQEITQIFIGHIDQAIEKNEFQLANELGQIYLNNVEKREAVFVIHDFTPKVLEWGFEFHKKLDGYLEESKKDIKNEEYIFKWNLFQGAFLQKIIEIAILRWSIFASSFFRELEKYIEEYEKNYGEEMNTEEIKENESRNDVPSQRYQGFYVGYLRNILQNFCSSFFEHIADSPERFDIWEHYFPSEWKITKENLQNQKTKKIVMILFVELFDQTIKKVFEADDKYVITILEKLYPEINIKLWMMLVCFYYCRENADQSIKILVEKSFLQSSILKIDDIFLELFSLISSGGKRIFDIVYLGHYIQKLKELAYEKEGIEEARRLEYLEIFGSMLDILRNKKNKRRND
jgi:hypothetical protein